MARREAIEKNKLRINDNMSGSLITLYYRKPTPSERQGYANMSVQRHRNKVKFHQTEARLKYGMLILTGFKTGDFERKEGDEHIVFSCDQGDAKYFEDWKAWIQTNADDLVMLLAAHAFDSPAEINDSEALEEN